jgi:DNA-directed RNA polymerase specialized sigma24 family protein
MTEPDENSDDLQSLLNRGVAGDRTAHVEVLARASGRLLALTRMMLQDYPRVHRWEQTDDVFQQATLRLYSSLEDVKPELHVSFCGSQQPRFDGR